jgi:hypothetical protein
MANYVLLGLTGEKRMLLVDCERMTVGEVDPADVGGTPLGETDNLHAVGSAALGEPMVKGIDVAIAMKQQSQAASFPFVSSFPFGESQ